MSRRKSWKAVHSNGLLSVTVQSDEGVVCEVTRRGGVRDNDAIEDSELIAAAPDMLAVLEEFVSDCEAAYPEVEDLEEEWFDISVTLENARRAIARAKRMTK